MFLLRALFAILMAGLVVAAALGLGLVFFLRPQLPSLGDLGNLPLRVPLRVYAADGALLGEFGEEKRIPVAIKDVPKLLIRAILAAEDDRYYEHPGVDYTGLLRAGLSYARTGTRSQGGSTITMQVARNYYLTRDKTLLRKGLEILLALEIEHRLTKDQILELYINKIFLGHRAYGFGAAAQVYYGVPLKSLTLGQAATLAGLPKAPSRDNPLTSIERAKARRGYVLDRMLALNYISPEQHARASAEPVVNAAARPPAASSAPFVAEMARAWMVEHYGNAAYSAGYQVYTTLDRAAQGHAERALRAGLQSYDRRHGWRGPQARWPEALVRDSAATRARLRALGPIGGLFPAVVEGRQGGGLRVTLADTPAYLGEPELAIAGPAASKLGRGDVVRVQLQEGRWRLAQVPMAEGALLALEPTTGAIRALVGGLDFTRSPFNRVTQADRQPGSAFKPFIYAAALARGYTPATLVNDAPVVYRTDTLEGYWRPENYTRHFYGPTRLREALAQSRNLVSVRLLEQIGVAYGRSYCLRFGFPEHKLPAAISLALGTGGLTPLELARGYAVIANGGYRVEPYLVTRVVDASGAGIWHAPRTVPCEADCPLGTEEVLPAPRVLPATDAYLLYSMLTEVIRSGTATAARELGRADLAGKTGTTNDHRDAWFAGFMPNLLAVSWVGFDQPSSLGDKETGGRAALPIWMDFMRGALQSVPQHMPAMPEGIVTLNINRDTGALASAGDPRAYPEVFDARHTSVLSPDAGPAPGPPAGPTDLPQDLF